MKRFHLIAAAIVLAVSTAAYSQSNYLPPAGAWERREPAAAGFDPVKLTEAVAFARESESTSPRNLEAAHYRSFGHAPYGEAVGHINARGPATGLIIRGGYIVAEWGEPGRVDMTFSVTKSFLASTVGLAYDRKMIRDLNDRVAAYSASVAPYLPGQRFDDPARFGRSPFID